MSDKEKTTTLERHAQTIIAALILGIISWIGVTVQDQSTKMLVMDERMQNLKSQIEVLTTFASQPRFTKEDFHAEMKSYEMRVNLIEDELRKRVNFMNSTEDRIREIERKMDRAE